MLSLSICTAISKTSKTKYKRIEAEGSDRLGRFGPFYSCMLVPQLIASRAKLVFGRPCLADGESAGRVGFAQLVEMPQLLANSVKDPSAILRHRNHSLRSRISLGIKNMSLSEQGNYRF